ncbi:MAG: hypothetical protein HQL76_12395 [Magnetococcales bacterium]|nr:hypothetical protein [Magnetococcales bacterium]
MRENSSLFVGVRQRTVFLSIVLALMVGCAPLDLPVPHSRSEPLDEQDRFFKELRVQDARFQEIAGYEHLRIDDALRLKIPLYNEEQGLERKKEFVRRFLIDAGSLNDRYITLSLDKVSVAALEAFLSRPGNDMDYSGGGATPKEKFLRAYQLHANKERDREIQGVMALTTVKEVDAYWRQLVFHTDESIKTRGRMTRLLATAPAVPLIQTWIWYHALTDDRSPHVPEFAKSDLHLPPSADRTIDPATLDGWALLTYFAPIVVQERRYDAPYESKVDQFGAVFLKGDTAESAVPGVLGDKPTLYAYMHHGQIQGLPVKQLVYTLWYPEHPKLKGFDPEAGPMEGWTFRITLNREHRPLTYESVANCGCYYKIFPTEQLERWSRVQYPTRLDGKTFHLEQEVPGIDAVVPELVASPPGPPQRVVLYYSSGRHQLVSLRLESHKLPLKSTPGRAPYALLPYEHLENLPFHDHHLSLFDEDGLVRQAHRPECTLLAPSGLYHAGHPRQRATQMIYFDQADFDDPKLLETYLRLPAQAFGQTF